MKKVLFALIIAVALIAVSCSDYNVTNDLCTVQFGRLEAKDGTGSASGVLAVAESEIYWRYTAKKTDNGAKNGEKSTETALKNTGEAGYVADAISVSPGDWVFTLYGYLEPGFTNCIYKGEATATLAANSTNQIPFTVEIQDGTCGTLISNLPNTVAGVEYKVSMAAVYKGSGVVDDANKPAHTNDNFTKQEGVLDLDGAGTGGAVEYKQAKNEKAVKQGLWELTYTFTDLDNKSIGKDVTVNALILNGGTTTVDITYNESATSWQVSKVTIPEIGNWAAPYPGIGTNWQTTYSTPVENN